MRKANAVELERVRRELSNAHVVTQGVVDKLGLTLGGDDDEPTEEYGQLCLLASALAELKDRFAPLWATAVKAAAR